MQPQAAEEEEEEEEAGGNGANGGIEDTNLMPIEGTYEIHNPDAITDKIWNALKAYVYKWLLAKVDDEHRYLVKDTTAVGDIDQLFSRMEKTELKVANVE